ncbi:unnamed protein product [Penicillium salamii]|uniref:Uncharacterized protein n=1 Tax=Penicillium salamii TaxID=1612424 RepID=A0A9W4NS29_9EURO|nr:unnamed protein product [Penicillium salamii]CAG8105177.1 unnamed protein product [Penicillium salamii]CAG8139291.1 unnamed protein product [Penicillium salamii]CAG8143156.1 unnamed protein product [Penicillium salamii]CAG8178364.1 unnamed protein product [Penicillium salamii]
MAALNADPVHLHTLSPTQFLPRAAAIEPNAPAIYHITLKGKVLRRTYGEFAKRSAALAYYIKEKEHKRVGILATNTPAFLESVFGISGAGAVNVAINYRLKGEDIQYIFEHAEVDMIIADVQYAPLLVKFREVHNDIPILVDTDTGDNDGPYAQAILRGLEIDRRLGDLGWAGLQTQATGEDDMLALSYTSGTTSRPKGVIYTHRSAYLAAMGNVVESQLNQSPSRCGYLWVLPMFHAMGWTFPWAVTAVRGTHYCLRKIDYPRLWHILRSEPITHLCAAPTVNTMLCQSKEAIRLPRKVQVTVAASPPSGTLFEKMTSFNLHPVHAFGMTETYGPVIMSYYLPEWDKLDADQKYAKMARQGHGVITGLPVRVIKPEQGACLIDVARDGKEIGEIIIQGNLCAKGYYKDPTETEKLFSGGWMHSGDLAVWHEDGAVQIMDRAKDIIISGGENISSVAVENILMKHPGVVEAAVIGVPDAQWGETPKAFIVRDPNTPTEGTDILKWAKETSEMGRFTTPREVEVVDELPKTTTGKIQKKVLREIEDKRQKRKANL